jgi:glycosyltransferase involved in cell wall biosynthesis
MPQEYRARTANAVRQGAAPGPVGAGAEPAPPNPRISVVMAAYNGEPYLAGAVRSVLNQDVRDIELIIVDDCSTDRTAELVQSFADPRVVYHRNDRNLGQTPSLNVGLRLSRGEYIARIDADDEFLPGKLRAQLDLMDAEPRIAVCGTWAECMDEQGTGTGLFRAPVSTRDLAFRLIWSSPVCHVSVLMRREPLLEVGGYDESFRYAADHRMWSDLASRGYRFVNLPRPLVRYRVFAGSFGGASVLGDAGWESARIIRDNAERFCGLSLSLDDARAIHLRAQSAWAGEAERLAGYRRLTQIARAFYGVTPVKARLELLGGLVWSIATMSDGAASARGSAPVERFGLGAGRLLRRMRPELLLRLKSNALRFVRSSGSNP